MEHLYKPEMEEALVGAALIDRDIFLAADIAPADFHDSELAEIWATGRELVSAGGWVDATVIHDALAQRNVDVKMHRLLKLVDLERVNPASAPYYAEQVRDLADRRRAFATVQELAQRISSSNGTWRHEVNALAGELAEHGKEPVPTVRPTVKTSWTVAELYDTDFPEPQWAVPDIVPVGLSFLAGRPKVGKSWLALQIAHAVGTGGMTFDRHVTKGRVLYLALEDGPRRLRNRLWKHAVPRDANITFETTWRRFTEGGLDDLRAVAGSYQLVVVDTISRALGKADQSDLADMTLIVGDLQQLALELDIAIIVIDHHRKPAGMISDPIDDIVGLTAKAAVADAVLGLTKQQGKAGAVLKVTGRDIEEQELALSWDAVTCAWQLEGTVEEVSLRGNKMYSSKVSSRTLAAS